MAPWQLFRVFFCFCTVGYTLSPSQDYFSASYYGWLAAFPCGARNTVGYAPFWPPAFWKAVRFLTPSAFRNTVG